MERPEVLRLLESNDPEKVEEVKKIFHEQFNSSKLIKSPIFIQVIFSNDN